MAAREALHIVLWYCFATFFRVAVADDYPWSNDTGKKAKEVAELGIGIIIAIAIGSVLACISCVCCCYYCCCRRPPPAHQTVVVANSAPQVQNTVIMTPGASQPQPQPQPYPYPYPQPYPQPQPQPQVGYNPQPNAMPPPAPYPAEMPPPYPAEMPPYDGQQSSYGYRKM